MLGDKQYEVISERPVLTWDIILANMGGTFNLCIGLSFITVIELAELFFHLLSMIGKKDIRNTNNQVGHM